MFTSLPNVFTQACFTAEHFQHGDDEYDSTFEDRPVAMQVHVHSLQQFCSHTTRPVSRFNTIKFGCLINFLYSAPTGQKMRVPNCSLCELHVH